MKILVYSDYAVLNHSVRPEAEIFLQLAKMGHSIFICSSELDNNEPFSEQGITTFTTRQKAKISPSTICLLRKKILREKFDIVFATNSRTIPSTAFACMGLQTKLVAYRGTTRGLKRHDPTSYLTVLHPRINGVIAVSDAVKHAVNSKLYKNHDKTVAIFKGHNLDWYDDEPADLSTFNIPPEAFVVIAVARFRPSKGLVYFLDALDQLHELRDIHALIVGSGTDQEPYSSIIQRNRARERIHIAGQRADALNLIAASNTLVQASVDGEGLPRSIIEALSHGKPVITTTAGGAKEIIEEKKSGLVVPVRDSKAIASAIRYLYMHRNQADSMAQHSKNAVKEKLSHTATAKAYEQYFKMLAED